MCALMNGDGHYLYEMGFLLKFWWVTSLILLDSGRGGDGG
jgi:hypothetical protein